MSNDGRPCEFTQEKADEICAHLSEGKSLRTVCAMDGMPSAPTFFRWLRTYESFLKQYEKAKQEAADAIVEEMLDIADDGTNDWMETHDKDGVAIGWKVNGEHVQRSRLRLDARKWIASKLKPKKYGDKIDVDHSSSDGSMRPQIPMVILSDGAELQFKVGKEPDKKG